MKLLLQSLFLLFFSFSSYSQNLKKEDLNLTFINQCTNEKVNPKFEILMPDLLSLNYKYIGIYNNYENWETHHVSVVKTINDTIYIPRILLAGGYELHSNRWIYLNCNNVCDGIETDFYENGNKRLEGKFKNGKPTYIKYFRKNGILITEKLYKTGAFEAYRINSFDENGMLSSYTITYKDGKESTEKSYDKNGNLIDKL